MYKAKKSYYPIITETEMSLLFIGDIMGHYSQIKAAYDPKEKAYNYDATFNTIAPLIKSYDYAVANLEVTLAGEPYSGYPSFSSPDALAKSAKKAGIDVLLTANNHACDKGLKGIKRTVKTLCDLNITHTGTFAKFDDRNKSNVVVLKKNNIKVGLLNYAEHTNWVPTPKGTHVNRLDLPTVYKDINTTKKAALDMLIVMVHWGKEYTHHPKKKYRLWAKKLFAAGVDIIIGAHPHTLQPMHYRYDTNSLEGHLIYYSLGNFVSDQRRRYTNGGALAGIKIAKRGQKSYVKNAGYHLIWVNKNRDENRTVFEVLPVKMYEANRSYLKGYAKKSIETFISDSRKHLHKHNTNIVEW
jgi:poly-gamma-glutamate synthesis protein (capsule biosynthesis protein)